MTFLLLWSLSRDRWAKTSYWRIMTNIDKTCKKAWHNWAFYWNFSFKARHKLTWFQNVRTENLFKKTGFPKLGRLQNIDLKTFRTEMFFFGGEGVNPAISQFRFCTDHANKLSLGQTFLSGCFLSIAAKPRQPSWNDMMHMYIRPFPIQSIIPTKPLVWSKGLFLLRTLLSILTASI